MKYLKTFEHFDTPELRDTVSDDEYKELTAKLEPYKNKFQVGTYHGQGSSELNFGMSQSTYKEHHDMYGITESLYERLIKEIPEFKNFTLNSNIESESFGIHLLKREKLQGTRFNAEVEMWLKYHVKGDKILDYKKGKIYVLFVCGLRPDHSKLSSLFGDPKGDELDKETNRSFVDMVKKDNFETEIKLDDKKMDDFMKKISEKTYGHPDDEDKFQYENLQIYKKNLTIDSFLKIIPKMKKNYEFFQNYLRNKYKMVI